MESPSQIRAICQAGKDRAPGWYVIHRRISIYVTWFFLQIGVTANQASLLMMLVGVVGAALLVSAEPGWNLAGFCLLYVAFLLDKVDGEIARYRRTASVHGILLDRLHHRLVEPAIFLAVAVHEYQRTSEVSVVVAGLGTVILANIIEETQHLPAYILLKRLRQAGTLPTALKRKASPGLGLALGAFRPLKGFRMFIVALPLVALAYAVEWKTGWPAGSYYLYASVAALAVYVVFQCAYYYFYKLEDDIADYLISGGAGVALADRETTREKDGKERETNEGRRSRSNGRRVPAAEGENQ
ncbi:MAG: CDP-alcohol phosphatidyltransferase family protein [Nitrospirae bacterium]|nr:CDP-alcohol phosphatidyltransferase family protein [Nitrospirota bacterium]